MNRIKAEFNINKSYIYLSLSISLLTILPQLLFSPSNKHSLFLLLTLFFLIVISKFSKILFSVFIIFINLSNILIGHIALHWDYTQPDVTPRLEVAALSPQYETIEYLSTYIDIRDYGLLLYTALVLLLLYKFIRHFSHSFKVLKTISLGVITTILIAFTLLNANPFKQMEPFSIPDKIITILNNKKYEQLFYERENNLKYIQIPKANKNDLLYDKIIIVMGESVNKHHMALYGYDIQTTPFLSNLNTSHRLYVFNAISPTNQTRFSVPIDLTKASVHNYLERYLHSYSIISEFKANEYQTFWISNQARIGKYDSSTSAMAKEAQIQIFANLKHSEATTDKIILTYLDQFKENSNKEMYLIHLMGSHSAYEKRYDKNRSLFKTPSNITQEYDNSIYYTDYVLSQIYNKFKNNKLLLVYLSDHAEIVHSEKHGHGFLTPWKDEYDVPFVLYSNVKNPRLEEIYKRNQDKYFNLENFDSIINYISGLSNDKNISYSSTVIAADPKNLVDYNSLTYFK